MSPNDRLVKIGEHIMYNPYDIYKYIRHYINPNYEVKLPPFQAIAKRLTPFIDPFADAHAKDIGGIYWVMPIMGCGKTASMMVIVEESRLAHKLKDIPTPKL